MCPAGRGVIRNTFARHGLPRTQRPTSLHHPRCLHGASCTRCIRGVDQGGVAAGTVIQATLGNHNGFQYIVTIDECGESIGTCKNNEDKVFVQGGKEAIKKGQRVVIIYGDDIRVMPYEE